MWIVFGLLLPLALYTAVCVYDRKTPREYVPQICAAVAGVWALAALAFLTIGPAEWPDTTQVAWTGIEQKLGRGTASMTIGGSEQTAVTAWPNGSFAPLLRVEPQADGKRAQLLISKGGAFAVLPNPDRLVNGIPLELGQTKTIGGYRFELVRSWLIRYRLRVYEANGDKVADIGMARPGLLTAFRILSLEYLNTRSEDDVIKNRVYDNWSRPVLIGITHDGLRILERNSLARVPCELPCSIRLRWRRGTLNLGIDQTGDAIRIRFARPWRHVSPLPEKNASGGRQLVVTRQAQPGDYAFVLPFGGGVPDPRAPLWILDDSGTPRFAGGEKNDSIYGSSNERAAVTSETDIGVGRYRFRFATSTDILHPGAVVVHLALAFLCFLGGLALITPRTTPEQRWIVCGLAAVLWVVLAFRVALSVRYALTPQFVDGLSVKGLVLSLFAATLLPSLVLLEARLRCDSKLRPRRKQDGVRAAWQSIGMLAGLAIVALLQLNVADNLWPALPRSLSPGLTARAPMMLVLLIVLARAAWQIRLAYFTGGVQATPLVSYETFADRASAFWRAIGDRRHKAGMRWYLTIAGLFAGLLLVLALLPGTRLVQEVFAPLVLTLLPALLWLSSAQHFRELNHGRTHNGFASTAGFWTRMLFWAVLTVLLPVFIFPAFIRDPGSVLATLAIFVPLLLVLAFAERAGKPAIAIAVCLLGAFAIAGMSYLRIEEMYPVMKSLKLAGNVPARVIAFKRDTRAQQDILRFSRTLEEAYTHTWENKAIAHEGGMDGLGFGKAPTRRSHVAQDTLQYDSVFSFFVLSEHGFAGGFSLLLIYLTPMALFLIVTRGRLTLATSFGVVISSAFFAEAWFHVAMNSGVVPFAGRNLPLLSVHSGSDMLKWLCLFIVAAGTPFWGGSAARQTTTDVILPERRRWMLHAAFAGLPIVLITIVSVVMIRNVRDTTLSEPFTWDTMLESVSTLTRDGKLALNSKNQIVLAPDVATEESLLVHQVKAFNQLPLSDRLGEVRTTTLMPKLLGVRTPLGYEQALRDEASLQLDQPVPYPPLFRLVAEQEKVDDYGVLQFTGPAYRIEPNSEFNTRISFRPHPKDTDMPRIFLAGRKFGAFVLQGTAFNIEVAKRPFQAHEDRTIGLRVSGDELQITRDTNPAGPRGDVMLSGPDARGRMREEPYFRFTVEGGKHLFIENQLRASLRIRRADQDLSVPAGRRVQVFGGDRVHLPAQTAVDPAFNVFETDPPPLIGPAWVMGRWQIAWDAGSPLPWTPYLATALESEWERLGPAVARKQYEMLTLDSVLQRDAQDDVASIGHGLHTGRLRRYAPRVSAKATVATLARATQNAHPPRVALSVISIPDGAVLAMAGWPRTAPGSIGRPCTTSDSWCPPTSWIDRIAPAYVRSRYGGDRNFDRIEMGSSTKPLLAAAALAVDPRLENLSATGPNEIETELFGITIKGVGWEAHTSPRWTDFSNYLAQSDNRYQVRLGFLALARRNVNGQIATEPQASPSMRESFDGATEWKRYPLFPAAMKFGTKNPDEMVRIDDALFAQKIRTMLGAGVRQGDFRVLHSSFWTRNGEDDVNPAAVPEPLKGEPRTTAPVGRAFDVISPEVANLSMDYITNPRQYVSLLLGGNENRWSNVEFAGAFATTVTGHPVMPYIVRGPAPKPAAMRVHFPKIASRVRPGLATVITGGTAAPSRDKLLPPAIARIPGIRIYGKTGTLGISKDTTTTSRLVLAIVRWKDEANGIVDKGIVLSLVAERAQMGDATRWLGQYVTENQDVLAGYLK